MFAYVLLMKYISYNIKKEKKRIEINFVFLHFGMRIDRRERNKYSFIKK